MAKKSLDRVSPSILRALLKSGGTVGQVIVKGSDGEYDFEWGNPGGVQYGFQGQAYAVWSGVGLVFNVFWPIYFIDGVSYPSGSTTVELDAADATFDRLDVIALDSTGVIVLTGTPAADPVKPTVDNLTQLEITTILVGATSTEPDEVYDEDIYKENVEWVGSSDIAGADFADTTSPHAGTKDVSIGSFTANKYVRFIDGGTHDRNDYGFIKFYVKLKAVFSPTAGFILSLKNGSTVISSQVTVTNGLYGFSRTNVSDYQLIAIPLGDFLMFTSTTLFDTVNFLMKGSNGSGFYLDDIVLQGGIVIVGGSGIQSIVAGDNIIIDNSDPSNPIIHSTGGSGSGDVVGPASATDGAVVLYDGTTGKLIKNSTILPTTVGIAIANLTNPSAITFIRINADNSVTARSAANFLSDIGGAPLASPTFTGTVTVPTPSNPTDAATKAYVDAAIITESEYAKIQAIWYHLNPF